MNDILKKIELPSCFMKVASTKSGLHKCGNYSCGMRKGCKFSGNFMVRGG